MNQYEISKLKKQLQRKNQLLKEEREDRQFTEQQLIQVQAERDKYHGELMVARQAIENVDHIIAENVREMKVKIEQQNAASLNELQNLRERLMEEQHFNEKLKEQNRNKDTVISELSARLRELSLKHKDNSYLITTKEITEQAMISHNQFYKLTEKYNKLSQDMENILAENKILRKLHGVPDNFGFDLEEIKIAEKQELEDYKAQCRKLEAEIEELEAERTQLRYRLRQYNTLYSNKGERYKDLTQRQLELLDIYAMNLKEGRIELPQIDKSQKEMEKQIIKLRAKIQVLQNRGQVNIMPQRNNTMEQSNQGDKISQQSMRKFQDQIRSTLEPFVQDIRRLSETNLSSLIQNLQNLQGQQPIDTGYVPSTNAISSFHPPQPLPIAHNDWSKIKQGYSYKYASKIPVDLKDYEDDIGFDQLKAKYQIAALQLQNIESLKMLKQKQDQENILIRQLKDLKQKYVKCLKVQDDLFVRYFTQKELEREKFKKTDLQKKRAENERDEARTQLQILRNAFNTLSIKTDLEQKYKDFAERLAKSEAGLIKTQRKYEIIHDEQIFLREAYTKLELKSSQNQFILKQKLLGARGNEKQLTMLMSQVLEETRNSVSSDTHSILLSKMEILNDKAAAFAFKQSELRLKIARLESVEREMNIKDEVIEHLRQDKLDLMLQLEIIRHRLQSIDPAYKICQDNFSRLVKFVNQNNISLMNAFKKFDRDGSASLQKDQLKSALATLGFKTNKDQFELLFAEFDLDGSQSVTYQEFMRKMKRGGANSRSKEEQAIYLFFKAIKQANISIKKAFQIVDMDGSNQVTQSEMETAFRKIGIECDARTIESVFKICDKNMDGSITSSELEDLYHDVIKETEIDEMQFKTELDWKYKFILMIEEASNKNKMTLHETFKELDQDGSSFLTMTELSSLLSKSGVTLERKYMNELFKFLDVKYDNKVQYNEFLSKLDEAKKEKKRIQRLEAVKRRAEELRRQNALVENKNDVQSSKNITEAGLNVRLMALESKQSNLVKKNQKLCKNLAEKEQKVKELEREVEETQDSYEKARSQYHAVLQQNTIWQEKMKNYIGEVQVKRMKEDIARLKVKNSEIVPQLDTYKGYYSALHDKNKSDLLSIEKLKAELNKYYQITKELQSENIDKAKLGQIAIELQYSKRNEQQTNKKYEDIIEKIGNIEKQNVTLSSEVFEKEKQIVNIHLAMMEKSNLLQKKVDTLTSKILPTVSINKIDEFVAKLRTISNSKSQLEEQNKILKQKNFNLQLRNDYIQNQRVHLEELQAKLRRNYTDDSSVAIIDLTKKLSEYKMSELKARREHNLLKEKQEYYMRVNNSNTDNIKELEEELAKWDIKYNEREEFWRKRMADQMKLLEDIQREAAKVKESEKKAQMYFTAKVEQQNKNIQAIDSMEPQRSTKLRSIVDRVPFERQDTEKIDNMRQQIAELTEALHQKEREIYQLRTTLHQIVPEEKLRFSTIGSQIGGMGPTNSFIMQTDLTTSQLNNNAKRFLNAQRDQQAFYKQEAERMVQAAQQSIDTLQRIIDEKNAQIKKRDKTIEQLKRTMIKRQDEDSFEIQKLNQQIRQLRSNRQIANLDQLMERPTRKDFFPSSNNDEKIKSLMEMVEDKDKEMKNWENKYNELFLKKNKEKPGNQKGLKLVELKLKELEQEREYQKKKYGESESKLKERIKNLQKLSKEKDTKLNQLHKTIVQLKEGILQQKMDLVKQQENNDEFVNNMNRGSNPNDSRMQAMLQKAMETIQTLTKKNKDLQKQIKQVRDQNRLARTMQMQRR